MYKEISFLASAARTTSGDVTRDTLKGSLDDQSAPSARFFLDITAVAGGTPTLDVSIVGIVGGVEFVLDSFTQATGTGKQTKSVADCPKDVKIVYTIAGTTPSFTFSLNGIRH